MDTQEYLKVGLKHEKTFTVEDQHTASHIGSGTVKVLATPVMIAFMEITASQLLDQYLPEGYSSVGTVVNIRHLAPTRLGEEVTAKAEIKAVEGSQITLAVSVWEGEQEVGTGSHQRFVIEVARFLKGLEA